MKIKRFKLFSWLVLVSLLFGTVGTVFAQDPSTSTAPPAEAERVVFGIKNVDPLKSWFTFETTPGGEIKDTVVLVNETKSREIGVNFNVYDGRTIQTTGGSSFFAEEAGTGVAGWITPERVGEYRVPAERGVTIPFTVKVPEGTKTGEYFAMMMVQLIDPAPGEENVASSDGEQGSSSFAISIIRQSAVAVIIRVKGQEEFSYDVDVPDVQVEALRDGMTLLMHTVNLGNQGWSRSESGKISFKVRLKEEQNEYLRTFNKTMGYLGYGHELFYPMRLEVPLPAGEYAADIVMNMNEKYDPKIYKFTRYFTITEEQARMVLPTPTPSPTLRPGERPAPPPMTISYFFASNPLLLILIIVIFLILLAIIILLLVTRRRKNEEDEDNIN